MRTSRRAVLNQVNHESGDLFSYTGEYIDYGDGGRYRLVLLASDGTFTAHRNFTADILVVAGGGAGGYGSVYDAAIVMQGGTGGGCRAKYSLASSIENGANYNCIIGIGGVAKTPVVLLDINPVPGGDTNFGDFTTATSGATRTDVLGGVGYTSSTPATGGSIIQVGNYVGHMFGQPGYPEYCSSGGGGNSNDASGMAGGATGGGTGGGNNITASAGTTWGSGGGGGGVAGNNQRRKGGNGYQGVIALRIYTGIA